MSGLHIDGYQSALSAAKQEFQEDMRRLNAEFSSASSFEAEEEIVQQMRMREAKHRDLVASLQRSLF